MREWDLVCIEIFFIAFFNVFFFLEDRLLGEGDVDILKGGPSEGKSRCYVPLYRGSMCPLPKRPCRQGAAAVAVAA